MLAVDADAAALLSDVAAFVSEVAALLAEVAAALALAAAAAEVPTHQDGELAGGWFVLAFCKEVYRMPSVPTTFALIAYVEVELHTNSIGTHQAVSVDGFLFRFAFCKDW